MIDYRRFLKLVFQHNFAWLSAGLPLAIFAGAAQAAGNPTPEELAQQARSILSNRCFACHGPDEAERQAGLRLDEAQTLLVEAESGEVPIVAGKPDESELWRRIVTQDEDERMPPADFGQRLLPEEVATIESWISQGAKLPQHWSFVPPVRPQLPAVIDPETFASRQTSSAGATLETPTADLLRDWQQHPVDRFVLEQQLQRGMFPSPIATRAELLRRLSLDLIGLPPTPAEVKAFEQDAATDAYERQVDRLLASPAYGEHWARKWLDLARYADSSGYADDPERTIWAYRDWVVNAHNANMPIDQFTLEQIAGDLLPNPTQQQLVGTAFHRNTLTNNEGGTNDEEFRTVAVVDRVNTTLAVWMGVTMACAQCHTHKYDPFTHEEYFQLYAIFNQSQDADRRDESPVLELYSDEQIARQQQTQQRVEDLQRQLAQPSPDTRASLEEWQAALTEPVWANLQPISLTSQRDSDVRIDDDQSIHVRPTANNIVNDTYSLALRTIATETQQIHALGLQTLPASDLPGGGAGTSGAGERGGNFVLTGVTAQIVAAADSSVPATADAKASHAQSPPVAATRQMQFRAAYADYAQSGFAAANVVDNDKSSGWAVSGAASDSHLLTLIPEKPFELAPGETLELKLEHNSSHRHHLLGSFRLQFSPSPSVGQWSQFPPPLIATLKLSPELRSEAQQRELESFYSRYFAPENETLRIELAESERYLAELKPYTQVPIMRELEEKSRRQTFIQLRGNYKSLGDQVQPGVPAVFHPLPAETRPDRLALAHWLVDRRNPLTARVWVNRLWESLFGLGIVRSSEEFGSQGDRPTHPELLDWLACELMDQQWDSKRLVRLLVTSQTYRQTSRVSQENLEADGENVWLARGPRVRLSAEMVRDQALFIAGLLSGKMYGPPVRPPQPNLGLKAAFGSNTDWKTSDGEDRYRRGLYTTWRRSNPYPSMATFDAPSREVCTLRRDSTNTPLQALVTLNDPGFVEAAQGLARRVVLHEPAATVPPQQLRDGRVAETESMHDDAAVMQRAFAICTARPANAEELQALLDLLDTARGHFRSQPAAAHQLATDPLGPLANPSQEVELAAWTSVCNVLLNLDEVLMKR